MKKTNKNTEIKNLSKAASLVQKMQSETKKLIALTKKTSPLKKSILIKMNKVNSLCKEKKFSKNDFNLLAQV